MKERTIPTGNTRIIRAEGEMENTSTKGNNPHQGELQEGKEHKYNKQMY